MIRCIQITIAVLFCWISLTHSNTSFANDYETIEVLSHPGIVLNPGETAHLNLNSWRHIKRLMISAAGTRQDGIFEVFVNGEIKGTIHVPAQDPDYIVTVAEGAKTIDLRHLSGGSIRISSLLAVVSVSVIEDPWWENGGGLGSGERSLAASAARNTIAIVEKLSLFADTESYENYLLPAKIVAGRTYALARAGGDLSGRVRLSVESLLAQMMLADPYITRAMQQNQTFELAVDFLTVRNAVENLLR